MLNLIARLFIVALALLAATAYIPGLEMSGFYIALIVVLLIGLLNLTVRPILYLLTLPINIFTFGLFALVINALIFWFVSTFVEGFAVEGFLPALTGVAVVAVTNWLSSKISHSNSFKEDHSSYGPPRFKS